MSHLKQDPFALDGVFADCELLEWVIEGVNPDLLTIDLSSGEGVRAPLRRAQADARAGAVRAHRADQGDQLMTELLDLVLQAHGGIERWRTFDTVRATFVSSGGLLPLKGLDVTPKPSEAIATIREESLRIDGYRRPDWRMRFTPDRVVIESMNAEIVEERTNPRESFAGHTLTTAWDIIQVAYFNGYARWTYLTTPFFMAMQGFYVTEIEPWKEGSEIWRGLRVRFPPSIASHSVEQEFYFGPDLLLRRHDYRMEIGGGAPIAQYVHDIVEADGFRFPSKRRAFPRGLGSKPIRDLLLISIDLSDFHVEKTAR